MARANDVGSFMILVGVLRFGLVVEVGACLGSVKRRLQEFGCSSVGEPSTQAEGVQKIFLGKNRKAC